MSNRDYLTIDELEQFADITVTDETEANDQISQAEEMIDAYVRFQQKAIRGVLEGRAESGSTTGFVLQSDNRPTIYKDYLKFCWVEILGGAGAGQRRKITGNDASGNVTTEAFTTALDSTSFYRIYQLGKFPRIGDAVCDTLHLPETWYKSIPEDVKRAVAAQVEYMIQMGPSFFASNKSEMTSESIGDYSYEKKGGGTNEMIAPKARVLLKGIRRVSGSIE